jgi:hypothetical protein
LVSQAGRVTRSAHLKNALVQLGPWQEQNDLVVDMAWLTTVLQERIGSIAWKEAADDVERLLKPVERKMP